MNLPFEFIWINSVQIDEEWVFGIRNFNDNLSVVVGPSGLNFNIQFRWLAVQIEIINISIEKSLENVPKF